MKTEELNALGLNAEQVQKVFAMNGTELNDLKQQISTLKAERDAARTQLGEANKKLEGYDPDWKQKAEQARQQADRQVMDLRSRYAESNAAAVLKFSSASARKAFLADLAQKKLPLQEDGSLLGFEDYVKSYKQTDPDAFAAEGYPDVKDGGDPHHNPASSTREQFAAWFDQVMK